MITLIKKKGYSLKTKEVIYFPQWTRQAVVTESQMAKRMARGSTFSVGEIGGVLADFPQCIFDELLNGNEVSLEGLGSFKLRISGKSQRDKKEVTSQGCRASVVFEPAAELTSRLNDEMEFRFVKLPKSHEKD